MITWKSTEITASVTTRTPGAYGNPTPQTIGDTTPVEIVSAASGNRYLTIINNGPDPVFAKRGGDASATNYNHIFPSGFNSFDFRIGTGENLTLIAGAGKTATVIVAIAPEITI